ncbi:MAG: cytochrome b562 [Phycisphaerae bacterium]
MIHKRTTWSLAGALLLAGLAGGLVTTFARGDDETKATTPSSQPASREGRKGGPGTGGSVPQNLESAMKDMGRALKTLKAEAADPAQAEQTLKDIGRLERDTAIAKGLVPPIVGKQAEDTKAKELNAYRAQMIHLMRTLLDLEEAVTDQKPEDIKNLLGQIQEIMKDGHKEFRPKED